MTKMIGRRVEVAVGIESTRGTGVAPTYSLGKVDMSLYDKVKVVRNDSSIGRIEDSLEKFVVDKYAEGAIGSILGANSALYLFNLVTGGTATVGSPSDSVYPWTMVFSNTNQHKSASVYVKDANESRQHKFCIINKLELNTKEDDAVRYSAEFIGKVARATGQSFPSYAADYPFTKRKAKIYLATTVAGLGAATRLALKNFKITFSKNPLPDHNIGTAEPVDFLNGSFSVEGELSLAYTDQTQRNLMLNGTYNAMRISLTSESLIGATTYGSLVLDLSKLDFFGWEPDGGNDDMVLNTVLFKGNYDLTNNMINAFTINNARSAL